jgi:hypothetical protein
MVKKLKYWVGRQTSLTSITYSFQKGEEVNIQSGEVRRVLSQIDSQGFPSEPRYYFQPNDSLETNTPIPIFSHGNNKVKCINGGLIRVVSQE